MLRVGEAHLSLRHISLIRLGRWTFQLYSHNKKLCRMRERVQAEVAADVKTLVRSFRFRSSVSGASTLEGRCTLCQSQCSSDALQTIIDKVLRLA